MREKRLVLTSPSYVFVADLVSDALGWPLFVAPTPIPHVDTVLLVGGYWMNVVVPLIAQAKVGSVTLLWCGSDSVEVRTAPDSSLALLAGMRHVAVSEQVAADLEAAGVEVSGMVSLPTKFHPPVTELPEGRVVTCYGDESYGRTEARKACRAVGAELVEYAFGEITDHEMDDVIARSRVHIRLSEHDGSPMSPMEYMQAGRRVITNVTMPFAVSVRRDDQKGIERALSRLLAEDEPDRTAADYWRYQSSPERFVAEMEPLL